MSDEIKHECAVAMVVLAPPGFPGAPAEPVSGAAKLSLLLEKQHNRGQDGAGAAMVSAAPTPGRPAYWLRKSASRTPLADVLGALGGDEAREFSREAGIFAGHLRYATFGRNDAGNCHPFVHESSALAHGSLLAGNFNLANTSALFEEYRRGGAFPASKADGWLLAALVARGLERGADAAQALKSALDGADGAWTLCGATLDGTAFATRDARGIRPGWFLAAHGVVAVASERAAIQAAFDADAKDVRELPPGEAMTVRPGGEIAFERIAPEKKPLRCSFERIYFSRANDGDIQRERRALGAALAPAILDAARAPLDDIFFSYIPNSGRIAFHGLLERLVRERGGGVRFGEVAVKDAKFRTFIADAAARREFYKHVYDVTGGLVRRGRDTLVVIDDSIVRGNTMKNAILPMLDRLGPKRIVVASSAPPVRFPDCYGIDMSTLGELVAFKALLRLLGEGADEALRTTPLKDLYAKFARSEHEREIARLLTPPGMKAEVAVVYQTVEALRECLGEGYGDWYFTGDYPTAGGAKMLERAVENHLERRSGRSY